MTTLVVDGLRRRFGPLLVADDISFRLDAGRALGVVGPNGAGKSTLLNLISGALRPEAGTVTLDGRDVTARSADERCRLGIGRTHQVPRPFTDLTVFENALVAAGAGGGLRRTAAYRAASAALDRTGLRKYANERAGRLPLLDRKRLELARALATGPSVLLLDEIGGGLTEPELRILIDTVIGLRGAGLAVIWIEHIVHALVEVVDELLCLATGRVIAHGEPSAVLGSREVREVYLGEELEEGIAG
ncbi:ABC transporter ATP-binding protein [Paractinoplanes toevensis]|uniref:ABC transporter ATP-binding protein n=1 Tax=Paractinoplanes toevensis TaxID=571911 RepID=A0A919T9U9_9ACTN|nr:ATP-binding cassette domain-containing protein [Actinoplanes toevensis]GIM90206.1 ABC transporter ATP-binding protein [Actinoplanes toevensis]